MNLYLTRHGEVNLAHVDPQQNLSTDGRQNIEKLAKFLAASHAINLKKIFHSGKPRAEQTAQIFAKYLAPNVSCELFAGLSPNDPVMPLIAKISEWTEDTMIVGHLPYLGKLASLLLTGEEINLMMFKPGTTVCLENIEGQWMIKWMVNGDFNYLFA